MKMTVDVPESLESELYKRARADVADEITEEALLAYLRESDTPSIKELLGSFNINRRYEKLINDELPMNKLTHNDKLICMLYWMMYDQIGW